MLSWIPIVGPIIEGIVSIFNKKMDTDVQKLTVTRNNDTEEAKVSAQIIHDTKDDMGLRISRDLICFPVAVWAALMSWDTIVANHWRSLMWDVPNFPESVQYIPYAVMVFLLGNIGINMWNRK